MEQNVYECVKLVADPSIEPKHFRAKIIDVGLYCNDTCDLRP